ncbi:YtxH-like protein [Trichococcus patagoniensis]|uniref:YtxH-like protein n=1 Tax=Trichococcus patagoniensis TaxID=382641 RepID=A0A2T5INS7_9LACT|nr:YtxH domain-containing protein [Trichococcus patagoniensis]PTQ85477.1 YtxH-like protein [Trichococcus patagoniensis]
MGKFSSFVKGLMIGGGIALLLSPKPGKDIRKDLADKADEALDKVMDYTDQVKETVKETAQEAVDQAKEKAQETTDTVKQKFAAKVPEAEERYDAEIEGEAAVPATDELDPIEEALKTL